MRIVKVVVSAVLIIFLTIVGGLVHALVPGGLVSSHNYGTGVASTMSVGITVERAPPDSSSYFFAQQFFPKATIDHGGYFGIQTGGILNGQVVGKMIIFSIWNATAAEAGPGAFAQTFGGEGIGYSVRKAIPWQEGVTYTFSLQKDGPLWWRLTVGTPTSDAILLGRIQITQDVQLGSGFASFTEYFGNLSSCNDLPTARVKFSKITFGTASLGAADSAAYGNCVGTALGQVVGGEGMHIVSPKSSVPMTEYYVPSLDYYFMTSRDGEKALLDTLPTFQRTGKSFKVVAGPDTGAVGIVRYYFDKVAKGQTRGSHFYTLVAAEIAALNGLNPSNSQTPRLPVSEGIDSYAYAPLVEGVGGTCPSNTLPVYRVFRGTSRFPDDPNHRFTTDLAIYNQFTAIGWDGEGVKFCVQQ